MPTFYRGMIVGATWLLLTIVIATYFYERGKEYIVEQCLEHRAFTYGDGAWGCVRLRKQTRQVYEDTIIQPKQGELM